MFQSIWVVSSSISAACYGRVLVLIADWWKHVHEEPPTPISEARSPQRNSSHHLPRPRTHLSFSSRSIVPSPAEDGSSRSKIPRIFSFSSAGIGRIDQKREDVCCTSISVDRVRAPRARAMAPTMASPMARSPTAEALEEALGGITDEEMASLLFSEEEEPLLEAEGSEEAEEALLEILRSLDPSEDKSSEEQSTHEPDVKKRKRLERNRASAALSRERKRTQMRSLESRCRALENANAHLNFLWTRSCMENQLLKEELVRLRKGASGLEEGAAQQSAALLDSYENETPPQLGGPHLLPTKPSANSQVSAQGHLRLQLFCLSLACSLSGIKLDPKSEGTSGPPGRRNLVWDTSEYSPYEVEVFVKGGGHRKKERRRRLERARMRFQAFSPESIVCPLVA